MKSKRIMAVTALFLLILTLGENTHLASAATLPTNKTSDISINQKLTLSKVDHLQNGGQEYIYDVDGVKNIFPVPPKGFNPITATDEQLKEYAFPPRPNDPDALKVWENEMSHYKETPIPKLSRSNKKHKSLKPNNFATNLTLYQTIWCGYANKDYNDYYAVQGNFVQPHEHSDSLPGSTLCSWVGLGGIYSYNFVQCGTAVKDYVYNAWYEYMNEYNRESMLNLDSVFVSPGDNIYVYCDYNTSDCYVLFYVSDLTNGTSQSVRINTPYNVYYSGTSAEWIDERESIGTSEESSTPTTLLDYGKNTWSNCIAYRSADGSHGAGYRPFIKYTMTQYKNAGLDLAFADDFLTNTSFVTHFDRAQ